MGGRSGLGVAVICSRCDRAALEYAAVRLHDDRRFAVEGNSTMDEGPIRLAHRARVDQILSRVRRSNELVSNFQLVLFLCLSVVPALNFCIQSVTGVGDGVVILPPVYYPFASSIVSNQRKLLNCELRRRTIDGTLRYDIDFVALRELFVKERPKMIIFCNPHNPVGRNWSLDELRQIASLCLEFNVVICADEIWMNSNLPDYQTDLNLVVQPVANDAKPRTFHPLAALDNGRYRNIVIHCSSMSKGTRNKKNRLNYALTVHRVQFGWHSGLGRHCAEQGAARKIHNGFRTKWIIWQQFCWYFNFVAQLFT